METNLPLYPQGVHRETLPTAPGSYQPHEAGIEQVEVQHHGEKHDDNNQQSKNDSDIILPIDTGDVPQQKYLSVSHTYTYNYIILVFLSCYYTHTA